MKNKVDAPRRSLDVRVQILILLIVATILDYVTGPYISAAAFYIFPIGLAGWRVSGKCAALIIAAAVGLNAFTEAIDAHKIFFDPDLAANEALESVVYLSVGFLSVHIRHEQRYLTEKSEHIEALNRQMSNEMQAARHLQQLLSTPPPQHPGIDIGTFSATARILGGDALDVSLSEDRLAVLIADVSGKGSYAALATAVLLGMLEDCPTRYTSPAQTLQHLNSLLGNRLPEGMFVTALYFILDIRTGRLTWSSAGHERPLLVRRTFKATDATQRVTADELAVSREFDNTPLTVIETATYDDQQLTLAPGDLFFCYTDGLPDARQPSGKRLHFDRMRDLVVEAFPLPCDALITTLLHSATGLDRAELLEADLDDDITILAMRLRPDNFSCREQGALGVFGRPFS